MTEIQAKTAVCAAGVLMLGIGAAVAWGWGAGLVVAGLALIVDSRL